jgi:hypothetical protein
MKRFTRARPSPALVVAIAAVVAALAGTAVAADPVAKKPVTKNKVKKIANKQIKKKASGLSVGSADALNEAQYIRSDISFVSPGNAGSAIARCPEGTHAVGGGGVQGAEGAPPENAVQLLRSTPSNGTAGKAGNTAWEFRVQSNADGPLQFRAYVICAGVGSPTGNYNPGVGTL